MIETRIVDVENLTLPTWEDVINREYHPCIDKRIIIDTANQSIETSKKEILEKIMQSLK